MKEGNLAMKLSTIFLVWIILLQLTSCGYIMYPERRGQRGGKIDAGVAVLDGIGLLLFIIPGVIAFAVDFASGAIYLPSGSRPSNEAMDFNKIVTIKSSKGNLSKHEIETIVGEHIGHPINLDSPDVQIKKLDNLHQFQFQIRQLALRHNQSKVYGNIP